MTIDSAIQFDRDGDLIRAAEAYEGAIAAGNRSLDALLGLALLYWQCTDPGLSAASKFEPEFFAHAARRFPELLAEARRQYPLAVEPRFWAHYISWADLGEPMDIEWCRTVLRDHPSEVSPALYLFPTSGGTEARSQAAELLQRARASGTTGARYVASVLESAFGSASS